MKSYLTKFLLIMSLSSIANAGDDNVWVYLHLGSRHSEATYLDMNSSGEEIDIKYNEKNLGLSLGIKYSDISEIRIGRFRNSLDRMSNLLGTYLHTDYSSRYSFGAIIGLANNYRTAFRPDLILVILPTFNITYERLRLEISAAPETKETSGLLTLSVAFSF